MVDTVQSSTESVVATGDKAEFKHPNMYLPEGALLPRDFFVDWLKVADDEARHFRAWDDRLRELDSFYGALPVHDRLWESATETKVREIHRYRLV